MPVVTTTAHLTIEAGPYAVPDVDLEGELNWRGEITDVAAWLIDNRTGKLELVDLHPGRPFHLAAGKALKAEYEKEKQYYDDLIAAEELGSYRAAGGRSVMAAAINEALGEVIDGRAHEHWTRDAVAAAAREAANG